MPSTLGRLGLTGKTVPPKGLLIRFQRIVRPDAALGLGGADDGHALGGEEGIEGLAGVLENVVGGIDPGDDNGFHVSLP